MGYALYAIYQSAAVQGHRHLLYSLSFSCVMKLDINKKKYDIIDVLMHSWNIFARHSWFILLITLIIYIPINIILNYFVPVSAFDNNFWGGFDLYSRLSDILES